MSITGALNNAMSGLRAAGRGSELVSSNIANALTPGYGRRMLALSSSALGSASGVQIDGITRMVNEGVAQDRRLADARNAEATKVADFFARLESVIGTPGDAFSVSARMSSFESGLISAASRPDAPERLTRVVADARSLATSINDASKSVQASRSEADRQIASEVRQLNAALQQVETLNAQIASAQVQGGDSASLLDQRQQVVDRIGAMVPVRSVPRDNGQIALYSEGGAIVLDGSAAKIEFTPVNTVTPYQNIENATLSGLAINGIALRTNPETGALRGGSLSAHFEIRDYLGPQAQVKLDALARDLVERFQDPAVDPTLAPGDAGLFTDNGAAFDPLDEIGLSSRLSLHQNVDPLRGGEAYRIRDGVNATSPGNAGDATLVNALKAALNAPRTPASGSFGTGAFSAISLVSNLTSDFGASRTEAEQHLSFASARLTELTERQLADGVDTDSELQNLMLLERAYAANARVIQAVDEMMQTIMRL